MASRIASPIDPLVFACPFFLAVAGASTSAPLVTGYSQFVIRSQTKRAYTSAVVVGSGGIGGIAAALSFTQKEAPKDSTGIALTLGFNALTILICFIQHFAFRYQNARADKGKWCSRVKSHSAISSRQIFHS